MVVRIAITVLTLATCVASPSEAQVRTEAGVDLPVGASARPISPGSTELSIVGGTTFTSVLGNPARDWDWSSVLAATATGALFGGIAGGLYEGAKCTECDFWGAFYGAVIGGLIGLGVGLVISMP